MVKAKTSKVLLMLQKFFKGVRILPKIVQAKTENEYYFKHLSIINNLLPVQLTEKEIKVLAAFLSTDKVLQDEYMFNTVVRKKVREELRLSEGGLANYLRTMRKKGFIVKNEKTNRLTVRDYLIPKDSKQGYIIRLEKDEVNK